ncbi:MAG: hypothetical protein MK171_12105 [Pirellulales bacterium]|nr:hypothetical protein [Pirellulales bacterium]
MIASVGMVVFFAAFNLVIAIVVFLVIVMLAVSVMLAITVMLVVSTLIVLPSTAVLAFTTVLAFTFFHLHPLVAGSFIVLLRYFVEHFYHGSGLPKRQLALDYTLSQPLLDRLKVLSDGKIERKRKEKNKE